MDLLTLVKFPLSGLQRFVRLWYKEKGQAWTWTNEALSHKAFVPTALVVNGVPKGPVNIKLDGAGFADTKTDPNDNFKVTVLEIPK